MSTHTHQQHYNVHIICINYHTTRQDHISMLLKTGYHKIHLTRESTPYRVVQNTHLHFLLLMAGQWSMHLVSTTGDSTAMCWVRNSLITGQ